MISLFLTTILLSVWFEPAPEDLLTLDNIYLWLDIPLTDQEKLLVDGLPSVLGDYSNHLEPSWPVVDSIAVLDPLHSSLWAGSQWSVEISTTSIPDSSYKSTVGLLQNSRDYHKYSASLLRPLPAGIGFSLSAGREDTLYRQRMLLTRNNLGIAGAAWQSGNNYGHIIWSEFRNERFMSRAAFARLFPGNRHWEGLASSGFSINDNLELECGTGFMFSDSLFNGEAHVRSTGIAGRFGLIARGDTYFNKDDIRFSGASGFDLDVGHSFFLSLGIIAPGKGSNPYFLSSLTAGPVVLSAGYEENRGIFSGIHAAVNRFGKASVEYDTDSLVISGTLLPGIRYGSSTIFAGISGRFLVKDEYTDEELNVLACFTFPRFALILAFEDITSDDNRSSTYGIYWRFNDLPVSFSSDRSGEEE